MQCQPDTAEQSASEKQGAVHFDVLVSQNPWQFVVMSQLIPIATVPAGGPHAETMGVGIVDVLPSRRKTQASPLVQSALLRQASRQWLLDSPLNRTHRPLWQSLPVGLVQLEPSCPLPPPNAQYAE